MIAIPITGTNEKKMLVQLKQAQQKADIVEVRLDYLEDLSFQNMKKTLSTITEAKTKPIIITVRSIKEGGKFPNQQEDQVAIYREALMQKAEYIDIEIGWESKSYKKLEKVKGATLVITSYHNFKKTLTTYGLKEIVRRLNRTHPDILKIACIAEKSEDNVRILDLIDTVKTRYKKPIISLCMGEKGTPSRVLQESVGGYLTFASLSDNHSSAPGQVSYEELVNLKKQLNC